MTSGRVTYWAWVVALALFASGCANRPVPVEGVVVFDGKPLDKANLVFLPEDASRLDEGQRQGSGFTDSEGHFRLETGNSVGAYPGRYKVTVSKRVLPEGLPPPRNPAEMY